MCACSMCGVLMREGTLPLSCDAYNKKLCSLCFLRNCTTEKQEERSEPYNCVWWRAADSQGICEIEYMTHGDDEAPAIALVSWGGGTMCAHLHELVGTNATGYTTF